MVLLIPGTLNDVHGVFENFLVIFYFLKFSSIHKHGRDRLFWKF